MLQFCYHPSQSNEILINNEINEISQTALETDGRINYGTFLDILGPTAPYS